MEMISEKILYLRYQTHRLLVSMSPHRLQVHIRRKNYLHDLMMPIGLNIKFSKLYTLYIQSCQEKSSSTNDCPYHINPHSFQTQVRPIAGPHHAEPHHKPSLSRLLTLLQTAHWLLIHIITHGSPHQSKGKIIHITIKSTWLKNVKPMEIKIIIKFAIILFGYWCNLGWVLFARIAI